MITTARALPRILTRVTWTLFALLALALIVTFLRTDAVGISLKTAVAALTLLACLAPSAALLVFAAVLPLTASIAVLTGGVLSGTALAEAAALAVLGPWLARRALQRPAGPASEARCAAPAAVFASIAAASCAVQLASLQPQMGGAALAFEIWSLLTREYFERSNLLGMIVTTAATLEGLGLLLMTTWACGLERTMIRRLATVLITSSALAAALNLHHLLWLAFSGGSALERLGELWALTRISLQFDRNAAGSVFAMMALLAASMVPGSGGWARAGRLMGLALILIGLWLAGSRTAMASAVVGGVLLTTLLALWRRGPKPTRTLGMTAALLTVAAVAATVYPAARNPTVEGSVTGRQELAIAAVEMWAEHPWFGAGIGRFYALSDDYGHPQMSLVLPPGSVGENAHNNFLQVLAELGLVGLAAFVWLLAAAAAPASLAVRRRTGTPLLAGLIAGVTAFILTWLTGHPLLVPEALYLFFIALGLVAAGGLPEGRPRRQLPKPGLAAAAAVVLVLCLLPARMQRASASVDLEHLGQGLSAWQRSSAIERYRWAGAWCALYLPTSAGAINLPLKAGTGSVRVDLVLDGRPANRVWVSDREWTHVRLVLPPAETRFRRLELHGWSASGAVSLMVGKAVGLVEEMRDVPVKPAPPTQRRTPGDYDGDGATEKMVYLAASGEWLADGRRVAVLGGPGEVPAPADYDADGRTDIATFRDSDGTWRFAGGTTLRFGHPGDAPIPGDYDGDRRADLALFASSSGTWSVQGHPAVQFGDPGDIPVAADYDGDGSTDVAVYRPSSGVWYAEGLFAIQFGDAGDLPVPGDYNGDGRVDLAVYRPSDRTWHVRQQRTVTFGGVDDVPVPGDYDADGRTDIAVYRPATGKWFTLDEASSGFLIRLWRIVWDR